MKKHILRIIVPLLLLPIFSKSQTIKFEGKDYFINGANIPWNAFGNDVGYSYNSIWFENMFTESEKAGINCLRLWIHCDGRGTPAFTTTGMVSGVGSSFFTAFDDIFERARKHHIMIMPCLWSFDMTNANRADLIQDTTKTNSYINNVLIPMTKRYADQCNLFAWEIINEPEWSMKVNDGAKTTQTVSALEMQRFVGKLTAAIHRNSSKMVTVGSATLKYNSTASRCFANYWSDAALKSAAKDSLAYLDFYQIHYYDWMYPNYDPFDFLKPFSYWKLDKPVLIGETPGKDDMYPPNKMLEKALKNKFGGVMFWSIAAGDGVSTMSDFRTSLSDFRINHFDSVAFSCDKTEKLSADSTFLIATNSITLGVDSKSSKGLPVSSNIPWTITNNVPWLSTTPNAANASDTVVFSTLSSNDSTSNRVDTVWIKASEKLSEMIIVTQQKPSFFVYPFKIDLTSKIYSNTTFTITTNLNWEITGIDTTWLNVYPKSGSGTTKVTIVSIAGNETGSIRSAVLTVSNNHLPSTTVTINQAVLSGMVDNVTPLITPNPNNGTFTLPIDNGTLEIISLTGEKLYTSAFVTNQPISVPNLPNGIYLLKAQTTNNVYINKLIISR